MELPDDDVEILKHVALWFMLTDTVVIYTVVILIVYLLVIIEIKKLKRHNSRRFQASAYELLLKQCGQQIGHLV